MGEGFSFFQFINNINSRIRLRVGYVNEIFSDYPILLNQTSIKYYGGILFFIILGAFSFGFGAGFPDAARLKLL